MNILHVDKDAPLTGLLEPVVAKLRVGAVVVLPTDTVYGLAVAVDAANTPDRLFALKGRESGKAIACLVTGAEALSIYGEDVPSYAFALAERYWPGALTLVVKASPCVPLSFRADDGSIALRAPAHPIAQVLLKKLGAPLATTSANLSGRAPALSVSELADELAAKADLIIDGGPSSGAVPSTIISCLGSCPQVVRVGALSVSASMLQ